jgi:hypothetical protein
MCKKQGQRQNWRRNWLSSIQEFADFDTQKRRWLDIDEPSPHFSFVEYMSSYFDDLGFSEDPGYKSIQDFIDAGNDGELYSYTYTQALNTGLVNELEVAAVAQFHKMADAYETPDDDGGHSNEELVLSDPKWFEVVVAAKQTQSNLIKIINDPQELNILISGDF